MRAAALLLFTASSAFADVTPPTETTKNPILCSVKRNFCVDSAGCTSASFTLSADGAVLFEGDEEEPSGRRARLDGKQLQRVIAAFRRARFFALRDDYSLEPREATPTTAWRPTRRRGSSSSPTPSG